MVKFVIEHPTRGWYTDRVYDPFTGVWKPRFSYSIGARDDRVHKMFSQREVDNELSKMSVDVRAKCTVKTLK